MSQYEDLCCMLSAAGFAPEPDGNNTFLLYIDPEQSSLISKLWSGGKNFGRQDFIADSVRLNSSASYLFTSTSPIIICISSTDELRILKNEDDEWADEESDISGQKVHPNGKVAAAIGADERVRVFFQDPSKRLIALDQVDGSWTPTVLPADPVVGSPIATTLSDERIVFYVSAKDNCVHYVVKDSDGSWKDKVFARCSLEKLEPKYLMVTREPESSSFQVYVLTKENALLNISQDEATPEGKLTTYGKLKEEGGFEAEGSAECGRNFRAELRGYRRAILDIFGYR